MPGLPKALPYPYHINIAGEGYMAAEDKDGNVLISDRPPNQDDVVPTDFGANASNPSFGKWQPYGDFSLGFGKKIQEMYQDRKAFKALGVDASQMNKLFMGPAITQATPSTTDATNGWLDFFEIGGALYGVVGQYVLKRVSDSNFSTTGGRDFGGGHAAIRGTAVFQNKGGTKYAFIPMGATDHFFYFDGTTYTQHASMTALCFCQVGREFYRAISPALVAKVDTNADPTTASNWSADNQFQVGDDTSSIVRMWTDANGVLIILKTDGVYSLLGDGSDVPYYAKLLKQGTGVDNGKVVWSFENDTFTMFNGQTYKIDTNFMLTPVGPELQPGNDSILTGYISAGMGHQTFNSYGMLYNPDTGNSYLMKYRTYGSVRFGLSGNTFPVAEAIPQDAWVGSISQTFSSVKGTIMVESAVGADSGHSRAWIGFSDGSYAYFTLPCVHDPTGCSSYRFSTTSSTLNPALFTALFPGNNKVVMAAKVTGTTMSATQYVQIGYKSDPSAGSYTDWGANFTMNGQKTDLALAFAGTLIDYQFTFVNGSSASTPVITAIEILWALQYDDLRQVSVMDLLCEDNLVALDGRPCRRPAAQIRSALRAAGTAAAGMTVVLPDEDSKNLRMLKYGERTQPSGRTQSWRKVIHIEAAEVKTNETIGTWARMLGFTWGDLTGFNWGQLLVL